MSDTFKNEYEYDNINITFLSKVDSYSCITRAPAFPWGGLPAWGSRDPSVKLLACSTLGAIGPDIGEGAWEELHLVSTSP